jgi:hypothetical protein
MKANMTTGTFVPRYRLSVLPRIAAFLLGGSVGGLALADGFKNLEDALGPLLKPGARVDPPPSCESAWREPGVKATLRHWSHVAIDASGLDHTPVAPGENRVFGEQFGPCRASRAMAMVHIAMCDARVAVAGGYRSYTGLPDAPADTWTECAISQAAHDTLCALFPSQTPSMDAALAQDLSQPPNGRPKTDGIALGRQAAAAILALRANDGSQYREPHIGVDFITSNLPGFWREDPVSQNALALGAYWGGVTPFILQSGEQFRLPPPPDLTSAAYTAAYNEVKTLGGDGVTTPTSRTAEQTIVGTYWAYDGTPSLCAPTRLYLQIALQLADQMNSDALETARLLALANVAMADAAIAVWDTKYYYQFWRPVTGIRESDPGTGPTGAGDGNSDTDGDPTFTPLGAPASNLNGPNFTPPFPSYPSARSSAFCGVFTARTRSLSPLFPTN